MEVVASLSQGRTAAAQCCLFTHKSVPVIFEPPCIHVVPKLSEWMNRYTSIYVFLACTGMAVSSLKGSESL